MRLPRRRFFMLLGCCLLAAAVCLAGLLHELATYRAAEQSYAALRKTVTLSAPEDPPPVRGQAADLSWVAKAAETLPGMAAWLRCEGTQLDYPVMQAADNEFYLSHLADGSPNKLGALFLDHAAASDLSSPVSIIYGHDIRDGQLFGSLSDYKEQSYYEQHPTLSLYTPQKEYRIELLAAYLVDGTSGSYPTDFSDEAAFTEYLDHITAQSFFQATARAEWGDRLVILSTCSYEFDNARLALAGRLDTVPAQYKMGK